VTKACFKRKKKERFFHTFIFLFIRTKMDNLWLLLLITAYIMPCPASHDFRIRGSQSNISIDLLLSRR